jgi:hypothetical protein
LLETCVPFPPGVNPSTPPRVGQDAPLQLEHGGCCDAARFQHTHTLVGARRKSSFCSRARKASYWSTDATMTPKTSQPVETEEQVLPLRCHRQSERTRSTPPCQKTPSPPWPIETETETHRPSGRPFPTVHECIHNTDCVRNLIFLLARKL